MHAVRGAVPEPPRYIPARIHHAVVLEQLRHFELERLDDLACNTENESIDHELAPHLHVGRRTLVERREVLEPVTQRFALRIERAPLLASSGHVVRDHQQRNHRWHHEDEGDEVLHQHSQAHADHAERDRNAEDEPLVALSLRFEEIALVHGGRHDALPRGKGVDELFGVIFTVLLDGAEPQRVGTAGNLVEQDVHSRKVDRIGQRVGNGRHPREIVIIDGLRTTERSRLLVAALVDLNRTLMGKVHERCREIVVVLAVPPPQPGHYNRMVLRRRNIAPVLFRKRRLMLATVLEVCAQCPCDKQHCDDAETDNESERENPVAVRVIGPGLLLLQNGIEMVLLPVGKRSFALEVRKPFDGKRNARFGVLTGIDLGRRIHDRTVGVDRKRSVKRTVAPCSHVFTRYDRGVLGYRQRKRHRNVLGGNFPLVSDVHPVQIGDVLIGDHPVFDGVIECDDHLLVRRMEKHVDGILRRIDRVRIGTRTARFTPFEVERCLAQLHGFARRHTVFPHLGEAHAVDLEAAVIGNAIERPPYRSKITVEIERPLLDDLQRPIGGCIGGYVDLRTGVAFRLSLSRRCRQHGKRQTRHGENEQRCLLQAEMATIADRNRVDSCPDIVRSQLRTARVLHVHPPCKMRVVTVSLQTAPVFRGELTERPKVLAC